MTATLTIPRKLSWNRRQSRRTIALVANTTALMADLLANTGRWGSLTWRRYGNVFSTTTGRLRVEIHVGDGSVWSPEWALRVYAETGTELARIDPSSREVYGTGIPAQMRVLLDRIAA